MFTASDYAALSSVVFRPDYPGYKPTVIEAPNGDGNLDYAKRYAHVAHKYTKTWDSKRTRVNEVAGLHYYLEQAHDKAVEVAIELGVPREFWPDIRYSALRVLEYKPGAESHPHTDFDLFTLSCYRNIPECFQYTEDNYLGETDTLTYPLRLAAKLNHNIHFGELLEIINPNFKATGHRVNASPLGRTQYSIVHFAIPNHDAILPTGETVGAWIEERKTRSRADAPTY